MFSDEQLNELFTKILDMQEQDRRDINEIKQKLNIKSSVRSNVRSNISSLRNIFDKYPKPKKQFHKASKKKSKRRRSSKND